MMSPADGREDQLLFRLRMTSEVKRCFANWLAPGETSLQSVASESSYFQQMLKRAFMIIIL